MQQQTVVLCMTVVSGCPGNLAGWPQSKGSKQYDPWQLINWTMATKLTKARHSRACSAHCSYLDIYISQKIRLCKDDFEDKFQFNLQAKSITFLVWKFRFIILSFLLLFCRICQIHCFLHTVAALPKSWHVWIVIWCKNHEYSESEFPTQKRYGFGL